MSTRSSKFVTHYQMPPSGPNNRYSTFAFPTGHPAGEGKGRARSLVARAGVGCAQLAAGTHQWQLSHLHTPVPEGTGWWAQQVAQATPPVLPPAAASHHSFGPTLFSSPSLPLHLLGLWFLQLSLGPALGTRAFLCGSACISLACAQPEPSHGPPGALFPLCWLAGACAGSALAGCSWAPHLCPCPAPPGRAAYPVPGALPGAAPGSPCCRVFLQLAEGGHQAGAPGAAAGHHWPGGQQRPEP